MCLCVSVCVCVRAHEFTTKSNASVIYDTTIPAGVVALAAGGYHTCALLAGGGVDCWGDNGDGQLGTGDTSDRYTPTGVTGGRGGAVVCGGTFVLVYVLYIYNIFIYMCIYITILMFIFL